MAFHSKKISTNGNCSFTVVGLLLRAQCWTSGPIKHTDMEVVWEKVITPMGNKRVSICWSDEELQLWIGIIVSYCCLLFIGYNARWQLLKADKGHLQVRENRIIVNWFCFSFEISDWVVFVQSWILDSLGVASTHIMSLWFGKDFCKLNTWSM